MIYNIWETLGIPPTSDKKEIKRAYARKSALCHPEEHPEEFDALFKAYKAALKTAESRLKAPPAPQADSKETGPLQQEKGPTAAREGEEQQAHNPARHGTEQQTHNPAPHESETPAAAAPSHESPPTGGFPAPERETKEQAAKGQEAKGQETKGQETKGQETKKQETNPPAPEPTLPPGSGKTPVVSSISQLVDRGMETEIAVSAGKLIKKLRFLHAGFPKTVNERKEELNQAVAQLEQLFSSQWFHTAGWDPVFLKQLNQWLNENRKTVNCAETVVLFRVYRFRDFNLPSYPAIPHLSNIHWEVMQHARQYERDMVAMAHMEPFTKAPAPKSPQKKSKKRLFILTALAICSFFLSLHAPTKQKKPDINDYYREKILPQMTGGSGGISQNLTVPGRGLEKHPDINSPSAWGYDWCSAIIRPQSMPFNRWEYEYYGKNQLTIAYRTSSLKETSPDAPSSIPMALMSDCITDWNIHTSNSFLLNEKKEGDTIIYDMETLGDDPIPFRTWMVPKSKDGNGPAGYRIAGCGYWAELFLHYASGSGISGYTWYDDDYNAHLVLTWDSVQNINDLAERMLEASARYYEYIDGYSPPLDLAIIYGPAAEEGLNRLKNLEKRVSDDVSYVTVTESEQLERCGTNPLPDTDVNGYAPLSAFDSSIQWISQAHMEESGDDSHTFYPDLTPDETVQRIAAHLNGLDWVLSRFEIKENAPDDAGAKQNISEPENASRPSGFPSVRRHFSIQAA